MAILILNVAMHGNFNRVKNELHLFGAPLFSIIVAIMTLSLSPLPLLLSLYDANLGCQLD